jgi:hypothetical protein
MAIKNQQTLFDLLVPARRAIYGKEVWSSMIFFKRGDNTRAESLRTFEFTFHLHIANLPDVDIRSVNRRVVMGHHPWRRRRRGAQDSSQCDTVAHKRQVAVVDCELDLEKAVALFQRPRTARRSESHKRIERASRLHCQIPILSVVKQAKRCLEGEWGAQLLTNIDRERKVARMHR